MNKLRKSIFNNLYSIFSKNKITNSVLQLGINIGIADFIYRMFSKDYLNKRIAFFEKNERRIIDNVNSLEDIKSKEIYLSMIYYRCIRKRNRFPKYSEQYFNNDVMNIDNNEHFIDCGAFDGDTIDRISKKLSPNKNITVVAFEPDEENYKKLLEKKDKYNNIVIKTYKYGIWSKKATLRFNANGDIGAKIDSNGECEIKVTNLDAIPDCYNATFIKMDIEGAELEALKGAKKIIMNNKPKLAISIYHSDDDMIDIIEFIRNKYPFYNIYVRHHSNIESETVMYCIKK